MKLSIRVKATLLMVALAGVPVALALWLVMPGYEDAVRESEERSQVVELTRVVAMVDGVVDRATRDAQAVALALASASELTEPGAAEAMISAVLNSREAIEAARLEVPSAKIDTVMAKPGADASSVPRSSEASRARADETGLSLEVVSVTAATLVVAVPQKQGGARGYVTVPVYLKPLQGDVADLAGAFDQRGVSILVVDGQGRSAVAFEVEGVEVGAAAQGHAVWTSVPDVGALGVASRQTAWDGRAVVATYMRTGQPGWKAALWRPQQDAYAAYDRMRKLVIWIGAGALLLALGIALLSARGITAPVLRLRKQAGLIGQRRWADLDAPAARGDELGDLSRAMTTMAKDLEQGEQEIAREAKLRTDLSRFVNGDLVDAIVRGDHSLELGGKRVAISVLFADMVAFTPLAESHPPEQVVALLNELFSVLTEVVFRHHGTVDKFIGDCLMAVWGAPVADPDHAIHALECAEDMMRFLEAGTEEWRRKYDAEVRIAIGLNSGEAIVGNIGSEKRMEYTVVGDVVNVAARLEGLAAPNQVLVADATHELAADDFEWRLLGERQLTGRQHATRVYELGWE